MEPTVAKRKWITSQRRLALGPKFIQEMEAERRRKRVAEAARLNAVAARRCPFCYRYKATSVAMHEEHERRCHKRFKPQLDKDRLERREQLRKYLEAN